MNCGIPMSNFLTGVRNHPYSTSQLKVRPYFAFALMKKRSVKCKVFSFWLLFVWLASELSSNQSLASILIPAHARNQAGASTPTNASATSGPPLFQTTFVLIWHPLCLGIVFILHVLVYRGLCHSCYCIDRPEARTSVLSIMFLFNDV